MPATPTRTSPIAATRNRLLGLEKTARELARACNDAADRLDADGVPPSDDLASQWDMLIREALELHEQIADASDSPLLDADEVDVASLSRLVERAEEKEKERRRIARAIARALAVVDSASSLRHADDAAFAPLLKSRTAAADIQSELEATESTRIPDVARALIDGAHPLAALLKLASGGDDLDDSQWGELQEVVSAEFGRSLGTAVARGRIVVERPLPAAFSETDEAAELT